MIQLDIRQGEDLADLAASSENIDFRQLDSALGLTALVLDATPAERAARWETRAKRLWSALVVLGRPQR